MRRPFRLGLTGSIGMGKSATAGIFAKAGVPVWDADAAVHRLYQPGGAAVDRIRSLFPDAVVGGAVDREALKRHIGRDPNALSLIEAAVHPLVSQDRQAFLNAAAQDGADLVVLDIPLLFETGADSAVDATLVVSAPPEDQRARVLARPGMTEAQFDHILSRQVPDAEKRARATYVIETTGIDHVEECVDRLIREIRASGNNA